MKSTCEEALLRSSCCTMTWTLVSRCYLVTCMVVFLCGFPNLGPGFSWGWGPALGAIWLFLSCLSNGSECLQIETKMFERLFTKFLPTRAFFKRGYSESVLLSKWGFLNRPLSVTSYFVTFWSFFPIFQ